MVLVKPKLCIDVGCGNKVQKGFVGMDKRPLPGIEVVHDAEVIPWPFEDKSAQLIKMSHLMEHLKPWLSIDIMNECWRILELEGNLAISVPYGSSYSYIQDPTHCNPWNQTTFTYFDPKEPLYEIYKPRPWRIEHLYWTITGDIQAHLIKIADNREGANDEDRSNANEDKHKRLEKSSPDRSSD